MFTATEAIFGKASGARARRLARPGRFGRKATGLFGHPGYFIHLKFNFLWRARSFPLVFLGQDTSGSFSPQLT